MNFHWTSVIENVWKLIKVKIFNRLWNYSVCCIISHYKRKNIEQITEENTKKYSYLKKSVIFVLFIRVYPALDRKNSETTTKFVVPAKSNHPYIIVNKNLSCIYDTVEWIVAVFYIVFSLDIIPLTMQYIEIYRYRCIVTCIFHSI